MLRDRPSPDQRRGPKSAVHARAAGKAVWTSGAVRQHEMSAVSRDTALFQSRMALVSPSEPSPNASHPAARS